MSDVPSAKPHWKKLIGEFQEFSKKVEDLVGYSNAFHLWPNDLGTQEVVVTERGFMSFYEDGEFSVEGPNYCDYKDVIEKTLEFLEDDEDPAEIMKSLEGFVFDLKSRFKDKGLIE